MTPVEAQARSIGFYSRGCLAGAKALPVDGESWQVVRLSRNRMWGNPAMIAFLERFSRKAKAEGVWNGILVGDISQPRGGPMLTGHASHQIGLDADVWLTPMPDRTLSREERETMSAVDMVSEDGLSVTAHWTPAQAGDHQGGGRGAGGRAHLRQRRDQEGPVRDREGPAVDEQGARLLGAQLPLPHPHQMPGGRFGLRAAGPGSARRWLRQVARLVVHRRGAASAPRAPKPPLADGGAAARMPKRGSGEIALRRSSEPPSDGMRVGPKPLGERENDGRNDEGQVNADQPIQFAVGFMIDVHEGLEQLDRRDGDDRGHQFELQFAEVDLGDPMRPSVVLPRSDRSDEIGVAGEKHDHDQRRRQRQVDDRQVRTEGPGRR